MRKHSKHLIAEYIVPVSQPWLNIICLHLAFPNNSKFLHQIDTFVNLLISLQKIGYNNHTLSLIPQ